MEALALEGLIGLAYELCSLVQNMSKNVELIQFTVPRMNLILEILESMKTSGGAFQVVNTVEELIKDAKHTFTKILKRGTISKFFLSNSDKNEILKITSNLDQCLSVLGLD